MPFLVIAESIVVDIGAADSSDLPYTKGEHHCMYRQSLEKIAILTLVAP
jgi:hypothetical protein